MRRTASAPLSRRARVDGSSTTLERSAANARRSAKVSAPGTSFMRRSAKDGPYGGDQGYEDHSDDCVLHRAQLRLDLRRRRHAGGGGDRALGSLGKIIRELERGCIDEAGVHPPREAPPPG